MVTRNDISQMLDHMRIDLERGHYADVKKRIETLTNWVDEVEKIPMPKNVFIIGRRWFQRSYGNTYHSVTIKVNGELFEYIPFEYGYDNQYKQTAHDWFLKMGYDVPESYDDFIHMQDVAFTVIDVDRKRDL